jgi:glucose-1-phosphate cytidylyltransferase
MATYGDGVANINIKKLLEFHESHGKLATVTAVRPPARFGRIILEDDSVVEFGEKLQSSEGWINGGFFVLEPEVASFISGDLTAFEGEPLMQLVRDNQLKAFRHDGFWQPMDTLREMQELQKLWESGKAPWAVWS